MTTAPAPPPPPYHLRPAAPLLLRCHVTPLAACTHSEELDSPELPNDDASMHVSDVSEKQILAMLGQIKWFKSMSHDQLQLLHSCGKHVRSITPMSAHHTKDTIHHTHECPSPS